MTWSDAERDRAVADALRAWAEDIDAVPYSAGLDVDTLLARWDEGRHLLRPVAENAVAEPSVPAQCGLRDAAPGSRPMMSVVTTMTVEATIVAVTGEIDLAGADRLRRRLAGETALAPPALVLDLTYTDFCSASGLSVLLAATAGAHDSGVPFAIVGCGPVLRAITALHLDSVFAVHRTVTDAVTWLDSLTRRAGADPGRGPEA